MARGYAGRQVDVYTHDILVAIRWLFMRERSGVPTAEASRLLAMRLELVEVLSLSLPSRPVMYEDALA